MLTAIVFIIVISLVIIVHEIGHFVAAKLMGVKVEEFSIGFPPRLFCFKRGETKYSLGLILFGGFVRLYGEEGKHKKDPRSYIHKKIWQRLVIAISGVAMNLVLASILISIGMWLGMAPLTTKPETYLAKSVQNNVFVGAVDEGSPAASAGLQFGDIIQSADNQIFNNRDEFSDFTKSHAGQSIDLKIKRKDQVLDRTVTLREDVGEGALGVVVVDEARVKYPWWIPIFAGPIETAKGTVLVTKMIGSIVVDLFKTGQVPDDIRGPVGIYSLTGQAVSLGFIYLLQLVILISINLAIFNILPFPALDGGRVLFLAIEKIRGKKVSPVIENAIHMIGFALLIILFILIIYRDIVRIF